VDDDACPTCGATEVRAATFGSRLRHWFVNGGQIRSSLLVCAGCGAHRRTGGGLRTTRSSSARSRSAARGIRWDLAPQRARAEEVERQVEAIRSYAASRQVLVPAAWDGIVAIGGFGLHDPAGLGLEHPGSTPELTDLSVIAEAGPGPGDPPWVRIDIDLRARPQALLQEHVVVEVVGGEPSEPSDELASLDPRRPRDRQRLEAALAEQERRADARIRELSARWYEGTVTVDGQRLAASRLDSDGVHGAVFSHGDTTVKLVSSGVAPDDLTLVATDDLEPLLDGMRQREVMLFG
jgi:hypothetical protein